MKRINKEKYWEMQIIDALPPGASSLGNLVVGDLDGDGQKEIITGGEKGVLLWYRPETGEKGIIDYGSFHVGLFLADIDNDGIKEVFVGKLDEDRDVWTLCWYKPQRDLNEDWELHLIDNDFEGGPHDIILADLDNDGEKELIATACYTDTPGIFAFKRKDKLDKLWDKYTIQQGYFTEGLSIGDLNNDGQLDIVCGPDCYLAPAEGPLAQQWKRQTYAPAFREMCRTALADITGNGRPDILILESEYMEGRFSWFENRLLDDGEQSWVEHQIDKGLVYGHSLDVQENNNETKILVAEMAKGGWDAPYNYDARIMEYKTVNKGNSWQQIILEEGQGTHQAIINDFDNDGIKEVIGKEWDKPGVHVWKRHNNILPLANLEHQFVDRDKPYTATDILAVDIDGDGLEDIVCGSWWYKSPDWKRYEIPGIYQIITAYDIDNDGIMELIATKKKSGAKDFYSGLSSEFCWLKAVNPEQGEWEEYLIGSGTGDWPHGILMAPVMAGEKPALIACYHSAKDKGQYPEIFTVPDNPGKKPWSKKELVKIPYGEEVIAADINQDGILDLIMGCHWLENRGNGEFIPHCITDNEIEEAARVIVTDVNGDGRPDIIIGEETLDFENKKSLFGRIVWFENPGNSQDRWKMHLIDRIRCPHSLGMADLDGDGEKELFAGEHDPFYPYRSRSRLFVYKKVDTNGERWSRYLIDGRFEHHDGAKPIQLADGTKGIISHGWAEDKYVNLWKTKPVR